MTELWPFKSISKRRPPPSWILWELNFDTKIACGVWFLVRVKFHANICHSEHDDNLDSWLWNWWRLVRDGQNILHQWRNCLHINRHISTQVTFCHCSCLPFITLRICSGQCLILQRVSPCQWPWRICEGFITVNIVNCCSGVTWCFQCNFDSDSCITENNFRLKFFFPTMCHI